MQIVKFLGDSKQEYLQILHDGFIKLPDDKSINISNVCFMEQIHSGNVVVINVIPTPNIIPQCDGLITSAKNIFLAVRTADCYPILVFDDQNEVIAVAHSGREGTKLKILEKIIMIMKERFYCIPENIKVEIGVGICAKHYQVSTQIADEFKAVFPDLDISEYLDLQKVIIDTALKSGISAKNIIIGTDCTFESENYFSFRRDKNAKRQVSGIGMIN